MEIVIVPGNYSEIFVYISLTSKYLKNVSLEGKMLHHCSKGSIVIRNTVAVTQTCVKMNYEVHEDFFVNLCLSLRFS